MRIFLVLGDQLIDVGVAMAGWNIVWTPCVHAPVRGPSAICPSQAIALL